MICHLSPAQKGGKVPCGIHLTVLTPAFLTGGHQGGVQPLAHNGKGIH